MTPMTYLSTSNGAWRIINNGVPICADQPTREAALNAAASMYIQPHSQKAWDGDAGRWFNPGLDFSSVPACV